MCRRQTSIHGSIEARSTVWHSATEMGRPGSQAHLARSFSMTRAVSSLVRLRRSPPAVLGAFSTSPPPFFSVHSCRAWILKHRELLDRELASSTIGCGRSWVGLDDTELRQLGRNRASCHARPMNITGSCTMQARRCPDDQRWGAAPPDFFKKYATQELFILGVDLISSL